MVRQAGKSVDKVRTPFQRFIKLQANGSPSELLLDCDGGSRRLVLDVYGVPGSVISFHNFGIDGLVATLFDDGRFVHSDKTRPTLKSHLTVPETSVEP